MTIANTGDPLQANVFREGGAIAYDDMQGTSAAFKLNGAGSNPDQDDVTIAGVSFALTGFKVNDEIDRSIQTFHKMKLSSILESHIHFITEGADIGGKFKFQLQVVAAPIGGTFAEVAGSPFTAEKTMESGAETDHGYLDNLANIPGINTTVSTAYLVKLKRIAAASNEYAGKVYAIFNDEHYMVDSEGSRQEGVK